MISSAPEWRVGVAALLPVLLLLLPPLLLLLLPFVLLPVLLLLRVLLWLLLPVLLLLLLLPTFELSLPSPTPTVMSSYSMSAGRAMSEDWLNTACLSTACSWELSVTDQNGILHSVNANTCGVNSK